MISFLELKMSAKSMIRGRLGEFGKILLLMLATSILINTIIPGDSDSMIKSLLSSGIMYVFFIGIYYVTLELAKNNNFTFNDCFYGFKNFSRVAMLYVYKVVFVTLWTFLLIIPGLIKLISYGMAEFILIDNPEMSPLDAITASRKMMVGHKLEFFMLSLSFIGWSLFAIITFGVGIFYVAPYMNQTFANYYLKLKSLDNTNGNIVNNVAKEA